MFFYVCYYFTVKFSSVKIFFVVASVRNLSCLSKILNSCSCILSLYLHDIYRYEIFILSTILLVEATYPSYPRPPACLKRSGCTVSITAYGFFVHFYWLPYGSGILKHEQVAILDYYLAPCCFSGDRVSYAILARNYTNIPNSSLVSRLGYFNIRAVLSLKYIIGDRSYRVEHQWFLARLSKFPSHDHSVQKISFWDRTEKSVQILYDIRKILCDDWSGSK
jgi:hypothetical protein